MSTQYWEEEIEIMSREKLQELQLQRLKKTINIAATHLITKRFSAKTASPEIVSNHWTTSAKFLSPLNRTCVPTIPSG